PLPVVPVRGSSAVGAGAAGVSATGGVSGFSGASGAAGCSGCSGGAGGVLGCSGGAGGLGGFSGGVLGSSGGAGGAGGVLGFSSGGRGTVAAGTPQSLIHAALTSLPSISLTKVTQPTGISIGSVLISARPSASATMVTSCAESSLPWGFCDCSGSVSTW